VRRTAELTVRALRGGHTAWTLQPKSAKVPAIRTGESQLFVLAKRMVGFKVATCRTASEGFDVRRIFWAGREANTRAFANRR